jgi:transposase
VDVEEQVMGYREVSVVEIREVLRRWVRGEGLRAIVRNTGVDRKTVRRYVDAAVGLGVVADGDESQLTDGMIGLVCLAVRPDRPRGHGAAWEALEPHLELVKGWVKDDLTLVKIHVLLGRRGVVVPYRTLHRFAVANTSYGRRDDTVRVADGEPGAECQVDFGKMGLIPDPATGRRRVVHALIFTACYSRHQFVFLSHRQTIDAVIEGFEAAWAFFGGVFKVVIPDNMSAIVVDADDTEPRFTDAFVEYSQWRGFSIDAARVRRPKDKPKVERNVPYVRRNLFAGEEFIDLADAQRRAEQWCRSTAGMRVHGTTQLHPAEVFAVEEAPLLLPAPAMPYDLPTYPTPKVHRDRHIEVDKAIYSVPGELIGVRVKVRADSKLIKVFHRGELIKVHPRVPAGKRQTDRADLPAHKTVYAMRDIDHLRRLAANEGEAIGTYADELLGGPLPWTKMRQVYRLLGLVKKWGAGRVDTACAKALDAETVNVGLIERMLERAAEGTETPLPVQGKLLPGRFARDPGEFAVGGGDA